MFCKKGRIWSVLVSALTGENAENAVIRLLTRLAKNQFREPQIEQVLMYATLGEIQIV
jgi:hypothetical protein